MLSKSGFSCAWFVPIVLLIGLVLSSCAPTTGTITHASQADLLKIKKIGILAKQEGDFSVRVSRQKMTNVGAVLFGLVGAGVEAGMRSSADAKLEEQLKPMVGDLNPTALLEERLRHYIQSARTGHTAEGIKTEDRNVLKAEALDALLEVRLKEWGLRLCPETGMGEKVQVGLDAYGRLSPLETATIIWERNELYLDGNCYGLQEFQSRGGLLKDALSRAVDNLAGRLVNDVLFP